MHCMIIGDIIAILVHNAMPQCTLNAVSGIDSANFARTHTDKITADITVISLTINDQFTNRDSLRLTRSRIITGRVVWLLPNTHRDQSIDAVMDMACEFGDTVVNTGLYIRHQRTIPNAKEIQGIADAALAPINNKTSGCNV